MTARTAKIIARLDPEANVWVATSFDIPGLVLSASTKDELNHKVKISATPLVLANLGANPFDRMVIEYIETVELGNAA